MLNKVVFALFTVCLAISAFASDFHRGIYITQSTLEDTQYLTYLINRAKQVGINTFVIDFNRLSKRYEQNIKLVLDNNIHYVARIVVFPGGGTADQVKSMAYWQKKYNLAQQAINLGADEIQLDYIRYNTSGLPSTEKAKDVYKVISWFKQRLAEQKIPLQIDVFGIASFGEEKYIGQNVGMFAEVVDAVCPMNYPSHFEPYKKHAVTPYETVHKALVAMNQQFINKKPRVYNYIELFNYRYPLTTEQRLHYIRAQIRAVHDGGAHGWYAWSAGNQYDNLFKVLADKKAQTQSAQLNLQQPESIQE